jgi:hypothetical protein
MIDTLQWDSLACRRTKARLIILYEINPPLVSVVQSGPRHHLIEINLFPLWYNWKTLFYCFMKMRLFSLWLFQIIFNSNMTSFFRFANKWVIFDGASETIILCLHVLIAHRIFINLWFADNYVKMRFCHLINHSFVCKAKEGRHIRIEDYLK